MTKTEEKTSQQTGNVAEIASYGKTLTVEQFRQSLADLPGDSNICLYFPSNWKNQQSFTDSVQMGHITGITQQGSNAYINVGDLI